MVSGVMLNSARRVRICSASSAVTGAARQVRGEDEKIWKQLAPQSTARWTAVKVPPEVERWMPMRLGGMGSMVWEERTRCTQWISRCTRKKVGFRQTNDEAVLLRSDDGSSLCAKDSVRDLGWLLRGERMAEQNFGNHVRRDHAFTALMLLNLTLVIASVYQLWHHNDAVHWIVAGLALAVFSVSLATRRYATQNQNRVIRLEENVRLHWMDVEPSGLTMPQMIALRFAPDAEVAELAARAVAEKLTPKQIKGAIVQWRADHDRI